jgi:putative pyruvate formate lyase activating enzyme
MCLERRVHNLNFVTPDHFMPHAARLAFQLKREFPRLPVLYNFSGYQSLDLLKGLEPYADIYLPDFKYSDASLAKRYSGCADYPERAIDAISEMVRQKGFLDVSSSHDELATRGVLVRHLILPGAVENSINALTTLFIEFGPHLPISLMSQYHPVITHKDPVLNRRITNREFEDVYDHAKQLGFEFMFVQFPESSQKTPSFVPDFRNKQPFG